MSQVRTVHEFISEPVRPLKLHWPDRYQSWGIHGIIGSAYFPTIHGKDFPFASRIKVTTIVEVMPPTPEDVNAMLVEVLPSPDAEVKVATLNNGVDWYCSLCSERIERHLRSRYYSFGGYHAHEECVNRYRAKLSEGASNVR